MTTKETLHELIDNLSDEEAAELLAHVRQDAERAEARAAEDRAARMARAPWAFSARELAGVSRVPTSAKTLDEIFEAFAHIPDEELAKLPSSDRVDEVVYRLHD